MLDLSTNSGYQLIFLGNNYMDISLENLYVDISASLRYRGSVYSFFSYSSGFPQVLRRYLPRSRVNFFAKKETVR